MPKISTSLLQRSGTLLFPNPGYEAHMAPPGGVQRTFFEAFLHHQRRFTCVSPGARPSKDVQDPSRHVRGLHDDLGGPLPLGRGLPQQPARRRRGPVHPHPPLNSGPGCKFFLVLHSEGFFIVFHRSHQGLIELCNLLLKKNTPSTTTSSSSTSRPARSRKKK